MPTFDSLPKDPVMLLSFINTQLRDHFSSLAELCDHFQLDPKALEAKLDAIGYVYDETANRFL